MTTPAAAAGKGSLKEADDPERLVAFKYNPETVSLSREPKIADVPTANADSTKVETKPMVKGGGLTLLQIETLILDGASVASDCAKLLDWTEAAKASPAANPELPKLILTWGDLGTAFGFPSGEIVVNLTYLHVTCDRFTAAGKPIRAKVTLHCRTCESAPGKTNPSSGGIEGRRSHTLLAGETLQHVATANYGTPAAWRAVAAANDITDPLGVPPGTVIYLPASTELSGGGR